MNPPIEFADQGPPSTSFAATQEFQDINESAHEHLLTRVEELGAEFLDTAPIGRRMVKPRPGPFNAAFERIGWIGWARLGQCPARRRGLVAERLPAPLIRLRPSGAEQRPEDLESANTVRLVGRRLAAGS